MSDDCLICHELNGGIEIYSAIIGTGTPHFHQHLLPRYLGTPPDVPWYSLDEWEGGPHGGASEIDGFVETLKAVLDG